MSFIPSEVNLSEDESNLFINYAFGNKTSKYNLMSESIEATFSMNGIPDNITIDGDYLWVGAQDHSGLDSLIHCGVFANDVFEDPMTNQSDCNIRIIYSIVISNHGF